MHQMGRIEECSLFNSEHAWADGYNRISCTCGWVSVPDRNRLNLTRMHGDHVQTATARDTALQASSTDDLRAELARREADEALKAVVQKP